MNIDSLTVELCNISSANEKLSELEEIRMEMISESNDLQHLADYLRKCAKMQIELESERKGHAEELRQINQDINLLEDMVKSLQGPHQAKRESLTKRISDLQREIRSVNDSLRNCAGDEETTFEMLDNSEEIPFDLIESVSVADIPTSAPPLPPVLTNIFGNPRFAFGGIPTFPPQRTVQPEAHKMKKCESCGGQIHRNAPTCPLCKCRTVSKNPKRNRKRDNPQQSGSC